MKKIVLLFMLLPVVAAFAQNDEAYVDGLVLEFTGSLESRGIATYFTAKRYCLGQIEMFQVENGRMCSSKGTYFEVYVVWKEADGVAMIKKIDNCGLFFSLPLEDSGLYDVFQNNAAMLKDENVKPYEVANPENNPILATAVHPCRRSYAFNWEGDRVKKEYKLYDLTNESKQQNMNFESNNELTIVGLDKMLDDTVLSLDSQFRRQF